MSITTDSIGITAIRVGRAFVCVSNNVIGINIAKKLRMSSKTCQPLIQWPNVSHECTKENKMAEKANVRNISTNKYRWHTKECPTSILAYRTHAGGIVNFCFVLFCHFFLFLYRAPICQTPLYVRRSYMSDAPICQTPLYVSRSYISDAPICQTALYVRRSYIADAPICQTPLYVRRSYMSDAPVCQVTLSIPLENSHWSEFPFAKLW